MNTTWTGTGTVTNAAAVSTTVEYQLYVRQSSRPGSLPDVYGGKVNPICGTFGEPLTLVTQDGLRVKFAFEFRSDAVQVHSIERPEQ